MRNHQPRGGNVSELVEQRLEMPVLLITLATLVLRSAGTFSGGAFSLRMLGPLYEPLMVVIGGGLALGAESLAAVSGRMEQRYRRKAVDLETAPGLRKVERLARIAEARTRATQSGRFKWLGIGASLYAGLAFLLGNGAAPSFGAIVTDLVTTGVVTGVVLFFGVYKEAHEADEGQEVRAKIRDRMTAAVIAALGRWEDGSYTDQDTRLILEHLDPAERTKFARAVARKNAGEVWTLPQVLRALGQERDDTARRRLSNAVAKLAKDPANGVEKDAANKWQLPRWLVMQEWGEAIARYNVAREGGYAADATRMAGGAAGALIPGSPALVPAVYRMPSGHASAPESA